MAHGLLKAHHGIMKMTALSDYEQIKNFCITKGLPVIEPKGKHWHKVEDATAAMLKGIGDTEEIFILNRGLEYYKKLITP